MKRVWIVILLGVFVATVRADHIPITPAAAFTIDFESTAPGTYNSLPGGVFTPLTFVDAATSLQVDIYRVPLGGVGAYPDFEIVETMGMLPPQFGGRSLSPFSDPAAGARFFVILTAGDPTNYSPSGFSIDVGDFNGSDTDLIQTTAVFNHSDTTHPPLTHDHGGSIQKSGILEPDPGAPGGFTWRTVTRIRPGGLVATGGFATSFSFTAGGPTTPSSVYWDNLTIYMYEFAALGDIPENDFTGGGANSQFGSTGQFPQSPQTPPVPEPGTFGLLAIGLAGFALYRRKRNAR